MLALLSNATIGLFLKSTVKRLCGEEVFVSPGFNTWKMNLMTADFGGTAPKAVFLILDGLEWLGDRDFDSLPAITDALDEDLAVIRQFVAEHPEIPLVVSSLDLPAVRLLSMNADRWELGAMHHWRHGLAAMGVPLLELAETAADLGREHFYSHKLRYLGAIPYSRAGEKAIACGIGKAWRGLLGKRRKCLVLDLDGTLWGGVIGEDGTEGLTLARSGMGAAYRDFQKCLRDLKRQGILLAVVSKNETRDALAGLRHQDMILREDDFVSICANWRSKPENIVELAGELNLGLSAFVFVDDNPIERESVRLALPDVAVPDFPEFPFGLPAFGRALADEFFPAAKLSREDADKTGQYHAEQRRKDAQKAFTGLDEYLQSLGMSLTVRPVTAESAVRAAQMTQKTNQFNLTLARYSEAEIHRFIADPGWRLWLGDLEDKFGSYGSVCLCLAEVRDGAARMDTFLMSCRAMGRRVESAFLTAIESELEKAGCRVIETEFVPGSKNSPAADCWPRHGYAMITEDIDRITYRKSAPFAVPFSVSDSINIRGI